MKFLFILSIFYISVLFTKCDDGKKKEKIKKLQIGVKKRIDNCNVRSKKGDFLHMHYSVCYVSKFNF